MDFLNIPVSKDMQLGFGCTLQVYLLSKVHVPFNQRECLCDALKVWDIFLVQFMSGWLSLT